MESRIIPVGSQNSRAIFPRIIFLHFLQSRSLLYITVLSVFNTIAIFKVGNAKKCTQAENEEMSSFLTHVIFFTSIAAKKRYRNKEVNKMQTTIFSPILDAVLLKDTTSD